MAGALKLFNKVNYGTRSIGRQYTFTMSVTAGQGYPAGGETLDFTAATNTIKATPPIPPGPPAAPLPTNNQIRVLIVPAGYDVVITKAAASPTLKNYNLKIFSTANTQLSTADYPAELKGLDLVFEVTTAGRYS